MCKCVVDGGRGDGVGTVGATVGAVQTAVVARGGDVLARTSGRPFGAGGWMLSRPPTEVAAALYSRRVSSEVPPTYTFAMEQEGNTMVRRAEGPMEWLAKAKQGEEREAIVAWLRETGRDSHNQSTDWRYSSEQVADAIGGGAHHE